MLCWQAYRQLALEHHPDKKGDNTMFLEIQAAYDALSSLSDLPADPVDSDGVKAV
jgi:hypothetical protein